MNLDDLAYTALLLALWGGDERREYLGALLPEGEFTEPRTQATATHRVQTRVPRDLVGLYHNHPPGRDNELFSQRDINMANQLGVPSYLAIQGRRGDNPLMAEIRRFDPGQSSTRTVMGIDRAEQVSRGEPVLSQFPIELYLDRLRERFRGSPLQRLRLTLAEEGLE